MPQPGPRRLTPDNNMELIGASMLSDPLFIYGRLCVSMSLNN